VDLRLQLGAFEPRRGSQFQLSIFVAGYIKAQQAELESKWAKQLMLILRIETCKEQQTNGGKRVLDPEA
jgi:hypothetical protein